MRKLFDNYGIVILICFVVVALIGMIGLLLRGSTSNGGWVGDAYKEIIESYTVNLNLKIRGWTDYTLEEIEADEHLYAIGKTKPEYVVAKFNSDYTEVTVVKNGEDSDGVMTNFDLSTSPFIKHRSTLKSAVVYKNITSIGWNAFMNCASLSNITIHKTVTSIGNNAFNGCRSLTNVVIPYKVTNIGGAAFSGCSSLTSVTLPVNVKSIGAAAFSGCSSLTNLTLPENLVSIGKQAFMNCTSLTNISVPNNVTSIEYSLFAYCTSLTSVTMSANVKTIRGDAFNGCSSFTTIYGETGSYVETWANNNGYTFVAA